MYVYVVELAESHPSVDVMLVDPNTKLSMAFRYPFVIMLFMVQNMVQNMSTSKEMKKGIY
jgi:hypothetical protein